MMRMGNTGLTSSWVWFINCGCGLYNHLVLHTLSQVLKTGWMNRRVASTSMNRESSRSHAMFTLVLESKKRVGREGGREGGEEKRKEMIYDFFAVEPGLCGKDQDVSAEPGGPGWLRAAERHALGRCPPQGKW